MGKSNEIYWKTWGRNSKNFYTIVCISLSITCAQTAMIDIIAAKQRLSNYQYYCWNQYCCCSLNWCTSNNKILKILPKRQVRCLEIWLTFKFDWLQSVFFCNGASRPRSHHQDHITTPHLHWEQTTVIKPTRQLPVRLEVFVMTTYDVSRDDKTDIATIPGPKCNSHQNPIDARTLADGTLMAHH